MLFHSSIRRELARNFGATLVVLATIVMTIMLIRTLGLANRGAVNPSEVMLVMGFTVLATLLVPGAWLHPFGPLLKNLPILALMARGSGWTKERR